MPRDALNRLYDALRANDSKAAAECFDPFCEVNITIEPTHMLDSGSFRGRNAMRAHFERFFDGAKLRDITATRIQLLPGSQLVATGWTDVAQGQAAYVQCFRVQAGRIVAGSVWCDLPRQAVAIAA